MSEKLPDTPSSLLSSSAKAKRVAITSVVFVLVAVSAWWFWPSQRYFPAIASGAYQGQITGLRPGGGVVTFYLEKKAAVDKLLLVVLDQGWKPQAISLKRQSDDLLSSSLRYEPVALSGEVGVFKLSGYAKSTGFGGEVFLGEQQVGSWSVRPAAQDTAVVIGDSSTSAAERKLDNDGFQQWLLVKSRFGSAKRGLQELEVEYRDRLKKYDKLQQFIKEETQLKARAAERRQVLSDELKRATAERDKQVQLAKSLVGQLTVLRRVSKQGQAIDLIRKVANRENNWYLANWRAEEDRQGMEEFVGDALKIDFKKLDASYSRAVEIHSLQREVLEERAKIKQLELQLNNPSMPTMQPSEELDQGEQTPRQQREKSFWEEIVG